MYNNYRERGNSMKDLFKMKSMKMADSLDWNCPKVCKRAKGDTQRIHKKARRELCKQDKEEIRQVLAWKEKYKNFKKGIDIE